MLYQHSPDYHPLHCYEHIKFMLTEGCSNTDMRVWTACPKNVGPTQPLTQWLLNLSPQGLLLMYAAEHSILPAVSEAVFPLPYMRSWNDSQGKH
jgi:hypothetical protein